MSYIKLFRRTRPAPQPKHYLPTVLAIADLGGGCPLWSSHHPGLETGIVPPPPGIPFLAFSATALAIELETAPNTTLRSIASNGIHPPFEQVKLQVGTFTATFPPGSFVKQPDGSFTFVGVIGGVSQPVSRRQSPPGHSTTSIAA